MYVASKILHIFLNFCRNAITTKEVKEIVSNIPLFTINTYCTVSSGAVSVCVSMTIFCGALPIVQLDIYHQM